MLNQNLPSGFLLDLLVTSYTDSETFRDIWQPVIQGLCQVMRGLSFDTDDFHQPLIVLSELCEFKSGNSRPICRLVSTALQNQKAVSAYFTSKQILLTLHNSVVLHIRLIFVVKYF